MRSHERERTVHIARLLDDEQWRARAAQKGCAAAAATAIIQTTSRGCDDLNSHTHTHCQRERTSERAGESRRGGLVGSSVCALCQQ
jgi:hypothetical protein